MIPTMWLVGAVIGRWWAVPLGAVMWLLLVVLAIHVSANDFAPIAALGAANTAVGVLLRHGVARTTRLLARLTRFLPTH